MLFHPGIAMLRQRRYALIPKYRKIEPEGDLMALAEVSD